MKPVYLLADSRILFESRADGSRFLDDIVGNAGTKKPSVAYIGASNGDNPTFYHDIFLPAFESADVGQRRMIVSDPPAEDRRYLEEADIILLAGGSIEMGWHMLEKNGLRSLIAQRYHSGTLLIGISAGAVQLGHGGLTDDECAVIPSFSFVPLYIGVHEEHQDWKSLRRALSLREPPLQGIGIPAGGGVMYHADELFPIRQPVFDIEIGVMGRREAQIYPTPKSGSRAEYKGRPQS
jgi:cyanophycinase